MRPILFHLGRFPIHSYGVLLVLGFLLCIWRTMRVCERRMKTEPEGSPRRISPDFIFDIGVGGLLVGIAGARLTFALLDGNNFFKHPTEIFRLWEGGLSLHGGMFFGILYLIFYCRRKRVAFFPVGDLGAPAWAIAYIFGRIGCLLNGCCYGGVCDLPWALRFPDEQHPGRLTPPSHPVQLYAVLFNLLFFTLLTRWEKRPHCDGELFFGYIGMYGFYRFVVEAFRAGVTSTYLLPGLHLTDTHIVSVLMMALSLGGIAWLRRHRPAYQDAADRLPLPDASAV
jgi:phosphatidylglycerol:prolipoprotein diacylglycerol transferase